MNSAWARLTCCFSKGPLKRYFLDICLTTFSESVISDTQKLRGSYFVWKWSKFNLGFKNAAKSWEKFFCFWDNCIWIGVVRLSLLRTGYLLSAANVLRSSPKIWHLNKRDFFEQIFLVSDQWIWWSFCDGDLNSDWARLPYCLSRGTLKWDLLDIYLTTFSESVTSKIKLYECNLLSKRIKFDLDFKNAAKHWDKVFCFWNKCIWIGIVPMKKKILFFSGQCVDKESKIWHVNKRDFFEQNFLASDKWIW